MLAEYPYLLQVLAGFIAGCSAVFLRRAAQFLGEGLVWLSIAVSAASAAAFLAGFACAALTTGEASVVPLISDGPLPAAPSGAALSPGQAIVGWVLALAGGILAGGSLRVRGLGPLRIWDAGRFEQQRPYRVIRRPLELGVMSCAFGLCWLRPAPSVWICLATWIVLWSGMLELGEWELRQRLPACRDYLKRTPRYLPRLGRRRRVTPRSSAAG